MQDFHDFLPSILCSEADKMTRQTEELQSQFQAAAHAEGAAPSGPFTQALTMMKQAALMMLLMSSKALIVGLIFGGLGQVTLEVACNQG